MVDAIAVGGVVAAARTLLNLVHDLSTHDSCFRKHSQELEAQLIELTALLERRQRTDPDVDRDLILHLRRGPELVKKCMKVSRFNFIKKKRYSRRLKRLEKAIEQFRQRETLRLAVEINSRIENLVNNRRYFACFSCFCAP